LPLLEQIFHVNFLVWLLHEILTIMRESLVSLA
jgi:hypothetical protein